MACNNCNESAQPFCDQCSEDNTCSQIMDAHCVMYHPDDDTPSKLDNLGLGNNVSVETILEKVDDMINGYQVPITKIDTSTVAITAAGLAGHTISANVKVSADEGNAIAINSDGIFVAVPEEVITLVVSPDADNQIEEHENGIFVPEITAARIIELIQNDATFRTLVCQIMTECMGECPNIVDITTG